MHKPVLTASEAVGLIRSGSTVALVGSGGGILEPSSLYRALGERFVATGSPRDLTLVHANGIGDTQGSGTGYLAHKGLVKRAIGGHWGMAQAMADLALNNEIEAYNLPQGVLSLLFREIAGGRPGLITHVGLGTFVDPRLQGGKINSITTEDLVEVITIDGEEKLFYRSFPVNVALIRGSTADEYGNVTMELEASYVDTLAMAQAAHNSGGIVVVQVKRLAAGGSLDPRLVRVPGILVDAIVVDTAQKQTCVSEYDPTLSGEIKAVTGSLSPLPLDLRKVVARRAALELIPGAVVNLGYGISDGVAAVSAEEGIFDSVAFVVEQGAVGGIPAGGVIFGAVKNPYAIMDAPYQFDFFDGGGIDMAFLGLAQVDLQGNINVSRFGTRLAGCGGFIDISQNAKQVVFCGLFTAGSSEIQLCPVGLKILKDGKVEKFVREVDQITFSGRYARARGQKVLYITERAVFELGEAGPILIEIAPGVDLEEHIFAKMKFRPEVSRELRVMDARIFRDEPMGFGADIAVCSRGGGK